MTHKKAAEIIRNYNKWRKDSTFQTKYPKGNIDAAIELAIETLELASENILSVEDLQKFVSDDKRVLTEVFDYIKEYLGK